MFPGMILVSSAASSNFIVFSGGGGVTALKYLLSKYGFSYSHSQSLAYNSLCLMMASGSVFRSRGVICTSGMS